jgi:hypothetical protein
MARSRSCPWWVLSEKLSNRSALFRQPAASRSTGPWCAKRTARSGESAAVASAGSAEKVLTGSRGRRTDGLFSTNAMRWCEVLRVSRVEQHPPLERFVAELLKGNGRARDVLRQTLLRGLVEDANAVVDTETGCACTTRVVTTGDFGQSLH